MTSDIGDVLPLGSLSDVDAWIPPRDDGKDCKRCENRRWVLDERGELKACPECGVVERWRMNAVSAFSSRSTSSAKQTFDNFKFSFKTGENAALKKCAVTAISFAKNPDQRWLIIIGPRGNGKSHLCAAVDNFLRDKGVPSLFVTTTDLLASLREAFDLQATTEQERYSGRMRLFKTAPVLILDDFLAESSSPFSQGAIFEIIDYRYRNRLSTMIATNVGFDEFDDPRIASRMQDASFCTVVENTAPDFRARPMTER